MAMNYESKFHELLYQAETLEDSASRVMMVEEAIRLADSHGDIDLGFSGREALVEASTFGGYPEKALVAFSWCLAQCDQNPTYFSEGSLLWQYKWVVLSVAYFPQLSRKQILSMVEDITQRYKRAGISLRPIYNIRCRLAWAFGETEKAVEFRRLWQQAPRDEYTNCIACEMDDNIEFLLNEDNTEQALLQAEPILEGLVRCAEVPHNTYAKLLLPLFQRDELAQAMEFHHKGYRLIARNRDFLSAASHHLLFLCLTNNLPQAQELIEKHLQWALDAKDMNARLQFYDASLFWLEQMLQQHGADARWSLQLPSTFPRYHDQHTYELGMLRAWFSKQLKQITRTFDKRNGNRYYSQKVQKAGLFKNDVKPFSTSN